MLKFYTPDEIKKEAPQKGASSSKSKLTFYTQEEYKNKNVYPVSHSEISITPIETKRNRFTPEEIKNIDKPVTIEPKKSTGINQLIEGAKNIFKVESPVKTATKKAAAAIEKSQEKPTDPNTINQVSDIGGYKFGTNILPVKKDDNILQKAGKSVVNFATGIPAAGLNLLGAPDEALRQSAIRTDAALEGKKQPEFQKTSFLNDIALSDKGKKAFEEYKQKHPNIGTAAEMLAELGASPTTWLGGGGILSEANKAKEVSTTKGLTKLGEENATTLNKLKEPKIESFKKPTETIQPVSDKLNTDLSPKEFKPQNVNKTEWEPIENTVNKVSTFREKNPVEPSVSNLKQKYNLTDDEVTFLTDVVKKNYVLKTEPEINKFLEMRNKMFKSNQDEYLKDVESINFENKYLGEKKNTKPISQREFIPSTTEEKAFKPVKYAAENIENEAAATMEVPIKNGQTIEPVIPAGQKERGFSKNTRTDINNPDELRTEFDEHPLTYTEESNPDTLSRAQAIFDKGYESARTEVTKLAEKYKPEAAPLAKMLAREATKNGNVQGAREILSEVATKLTEAGQFTQAAKLLRESDPETFLMTIDKQLKKLNEQGAKEYGKKWGQIDLLPDEIDKISKINPGDTAAYESTWEEIGNRIAKQLPSTNMEKFDAWRRMSMLLNPKTHIRNAIGNTIMMGLRKSSDTLGALFEKAIPQVQRTKSFLWSRNKDLVDTVENVWQQNKSDLLQNNRYEIDNLKSLGRDKKIFKNKVLEGANEFSNWALSQGDLPFLKRAYKDALGQFMSARGLKQVTDEALEYAKRRAYEATFKQSNVLSETIANLKRKKGIGKAVDVLIPFSKTPSNIASRAVEYSPGGIIKSLYGAATGKAPAAVVEDLAKGMTGSGIVALGWLLADSGWLRSEKLKSKNAEAIMNQMGEQANSFMTQFGSYTVDWMQPFSVPLIMGAAAHEALANKKDSDGLMDGITNSLASGGDTIFNMTMLKNIKDFFGGNGSITEKIAGIPSDYLQQAIPTILGQTARSIDDTKRNVYDPNPLKQQFNIVKSKIPFVSKNLEPKLDVFGNEQSNGGAGQQFLSPGYAKGNNNDPITKEVSRLYKSTKETDFLPKVSPTSVTVKGEKRKLSPEEVTEIQKRMGSANYADIGELIRSARYQNATDENRIKMVRSIVNNNYDDAKEKILK